jgi:phosphoglycolate phosphatase
MMNLSTAMEAGPKLVRQPCIGVDLDLTLIDTREATAFALRRVNTKLGACIDVDAFVRRLGPPIRQELASWIPEEQIEEAVTVFRTSFTTEDGLDRLQPLPGAVELLRRVRDSGSRVVVITSRIPRVAKACLAACSLDVVAVIGGVSGEEKSPAMREHGVGLYIGDHPLDMLGAVHAGVPAIGVTTGNNNEAELREAGATIVVDGLGVVAGWLEDKRP